MAADSVEALFDLEAIRDTSTLDIEVLQDWEVVVGEPSLKQKLIKITVCDWWEGQPVRIPVTLNAPVDALPCENILVINMGIASKPGVLRGVPLALLKDQGVGVIMVGMGRIDENEPAGELFLGMHRHLLDTKDVRYSATWIWGMSQMRGLTAAFTEPEVFQPKKVISTGGSKRGVASSIAGIWDDRFTGIMPVSSPPMGNPGGSMVIGNDPDFIAETNARFYKDLDEGKLGLDPKIREALEGRVVGWSKERIRLEQTIEAGWSQEDIDELSDRIWEMCHVVRFLPRVHRSGLEYFYNVGTNDSVTPSLPELGYAFPDFPIYIVPGGQHGGPVKAGYTKRLPLLKEVQSNLRTFARYHFFRERNWVASPKITHSWDIDSRVLVVDVVFPDGVEPEKNTLWWNVNKSRIRTLPAEYDSFDSIEMEQIGGARYRGTLLLESEPETIDFMTVHTHTENGLPLSFSSAYQRLEYALGNWNSTF